MNQKTIKVVRSFHCPWDEFRCENAEEAKFVLDLLQKEYPRRTTKMSDAVKNMVKHDRSVDKYDLFDFMEKNGIILRDRQ